MRVMNRIKFVEEVEKRLRVVSSTESIIYTFKKVAENTRKIKIVYLDECGIDKVAVVMMGMHSYSVRNREFVDAAESALYTIPDLKFDEETMISEFTLEDDDRKEFMSELRRWDN